MGFLDLAVKYGLKKIPLTTPLKNIPAWRIAELGYKTFKYSYKTTRAVDNYFGATSWATKKAFNRYGPASNKWINRADRMEGLYNKGAGYYDKLTQWGEKKVSKVIKSITDKAKTQPPVVTKTIPSTNLPKHTTPFPKTAPKASSLNLPNVPNMKLRPQGFGKSLPFNTYANAKKLKAMSPPAKSGFDVRKNKMFTIKTLATPNKGFSIKTKTNPIKIQTRKITPAFKPPTTNKSNFAKAFSAARTSIKTSAPNRATIKPLSKPIRVAPNRPAPVRRAPHKNGSSKKIII